MKFAVKHTPSIEIQETVIKDGIKETKTKAVSLVYDTVLEPSGESLFKLSVYDAKSYDKLVDGKPMKALITMIIKSGGKLEVTISGYNTGFKNPTTLMDGTVVTNMQALALYELASLKDEEVSYLSSDTSVMSIDDSYKIFRELMLLTDLEIATNNSATYNLNWDEYVNRVSAIDTQYASEYLTNVVNLFKQLRAINTDVSSESVNEKSQTKKTTSSRTKKSTTV